METSTILKVVLSSPGDVSAERKVMEVVIDDLNRGIARERKLRLELLRWETDAYPGFHPEGPQGLIDPALKIEDCDILLGIFWKRFGTPTKEAQSGTMHEINRAIAQWQKSRRPQIMIYFKEGAAKLKTAEEHRQYSLVMEFKETFPPEGLYWHFKNATAFERQARNHLTHYLLQHFPPPGGAAGKAAAGPASPDLVRLYCRDLQAKFAAITMFGEAEGETAAAAREEITGIASGFIPLHLKDWRDDGAGGRVHDVEALFFAKNAPRRLLLRGLPGSGKTTLLRYLVYRLARQTAESGGQAVPIYLRLRELNLAGNSLEEFVKFQLNEDSFSRESYQALCAEERFLEKGMILCLDGVDEIEDPETAARFAPALVQLGKQYPRCTIIVTSRPVGLDKGDFPGFTPLDLLPLESEMIDAYLGKWFAGRAEKVTALREVLQEKPRIAALAANPFLLTMICYTYGKGGSTALVERRSELYAHCTRYLLQRAYDPDRPASGETSLEDTLAMLKDLSLRFFLWQEADFPVEQVNLLGQKTLTADRLGAAEEVLERLQRDTGLLQRAREGFTFVHRSLWEYFTALALLEKQPEAVIRQAANPDWEEVIRLYAGLLEDNAAVESLVKGLWYINRPLALRVTTEVAAPAAGLIKPLIQAEEGNQSRLLLIEAVAQSLPLVPSVQWESLVNETLRILLADCEERDCEVIYHAQMLLEKLALHPLAPGGLIYELLDLAHAAARQQTLLADPENLFEWVEVEGGSFMMGDDHHEDDEKPAHRVTLGSFQMSKHPVTNRLLRGFPLGEKYPNYGGERHPAIGNTWWEAYYFALWIGARLPSEAQWEYAARGGQKATKEFAQYYFGDDPEELPNHAWFGESGRETAHAVDEPNPRSGKENLNPLGLANMLGNVFEWCADWFSSDYYQNCPATDPPGPASGSNRVFRGGCWYAPARYCRVAYRGRNAPGHRGADLGFRLLRTVE